MQGYVDRYFILADMKEIDSSYTPGKFKALLTDVYFHFPNRLFKVALINAGLFLRGLYAVVKPMMTEKTKEKVLICGEGNENIIKLLSPHISTKVIPVQLGGEN